MLLIQTDYDQIIDALASWDWLDFSGKVPFAVNCFGDIFFDSESGVYFLDTFEGTLSRICADQIELQDILKTDEGQDTYLLAGLVIKARDEGLVLQDGECYGFAENPLLGGSLAFKNMATMNFIECLGMAGQLHKLNRAQQHGDMTLSTKAAES